MSVYYEWDSSLESGHEKIDNQHKQLVAALNRLIEASQQGKGSEEVFKTLEFLVGYTLMHFNTEEKLQKQYEYPEYISHKQYHDDFKATVKDVVSRFKKEGATDELVKTTTTAVWDWLLSHIQGPDLHMAVFVKSKEQA